MVILMKILYKQNKNQTSALSAAGIEHCYLKHITDSYMHMSNRKSHHHTFFEVHLMISGMQIYEIDGKQCEISDGQLLFINPNIPHKLVSSRENIQKYAICFNFKIHPQMQFFKDKISQALLKSLNSINCESKKKTDFSLLLTECKLCEIIITLLRNAKYKETKPEYSEIENTILSLAKQYITDNIEHSPTVCEIANYCGISERQLTRIFTIHEGTSAKQFITCVKVERLTELILEDNLSLQEISNRMGFSSEYYFNAFFKKNFGMPPGEYRKMHGK